MKTFIKIILFLIILIIAAVIIECDIYIIRSNSMVPTLNDGDIVVSLRHLKPKINSIVVLINPLVNNNEQFIIKRIHGVPGDIIKINKDYIYIKQRNNTKKYKNFVNINGEYEFKLSNNPDILSGIPFQFIKNSQFDNAIDNSDIKYFFVVGDNKAQSIDSRYFGIISSKNIVGTAKFKIWPITQIKIFI